MPLSELQTVNESYSSFWISTSSQCIPLRSFGRPQGAPIKSLQGRARDCYSRYYLDESLCRVSVENVAADMSDDTVMWAASCTRLMTTVAAMQCVEKGLFTLDEDILASYRNERAPIS